MSELLEQTREMIGRWIDVFDERSNHNINGQVVGISINELRTISELEINGRSISIRINSDDIVVFYHIRPECECGDWGDCDDDYCGKSYYNQEQVSQLTLNRNHTKLEKINQIHLLLERCKKILDKCCIVCLKPSKNGTETCDSCITMIQYTDNISNCSICMEHLHTNRNTFSVCGDLRHTIHYSCFRKMGKLECPICRRCK